MRDHCIGIDDFWLGARWVRTRLQGIKTFLSKRKIYQRNNLILCVYRGTNFASKYVEKIKDEEGMIGRPGRVYEIDLCLTNEECLIFKIKSYVKPDEIDDFNENAKRVMKKLGLQRVEKAVITLEEMYNNHCSKS